MNTKGLKKTKFPGIYIDKSMEEKYKGKVFFQEKLDEANKTLKRVGLPKPKDKK